MERFDFSFKNKYVKWWFILVLPLIILYAVVSFLLPIKDQRLFSFFPLLTVLTFFVWVKFDKWNNKK